jgi:uncharacterized protein YacL
MVFCTLGEDCKMIFQILKSILILAGTITGVSIAYSLIDKYPQAVNELVPLENSHFILAGLLGFLGYLICSMIGRGINEWLEKRIEETNVYNLTWSALGFTLGTLVANLLFIPFYILMFKGVGKFDFQDQYLNSLVSMFYLVFPVLFNLLFAYLGVKILLRYKKYQNMAKGEEVKVSPKILDSSAIVDGRFADLFKLGFIEGNILVPNFIVNELVFLANSNDINKKNRGQKGLETIEKLKKSFPDNFVIINNDYDDVDEVNGKLVKLSTELKASLITQDFNTKKIAELENIKVLNLNDLSNALKPIFVSGEDVEIQIVKRGKEPRQGVGFLSDGTMVVIEDGGDHVGEVVKTKVNNILQTGAGRIVFCRIGDKKD